MLKAVVFDFDGVIVDSEPLHYAAFRQVTLQQFGFDFSYPQYVDRYIGFDDRDAFRTIIDDAGAKVAAATLDGHVRELCQRKAHAFEEVVNQGVRAIPGAVPLIEEAAGQLPVAIASGATRADIDLILNKLGLAHHFNVIVTADDVSQSKPDPQTYRLAVQQLGQRWPELNLNPSHCVSIEDTAAGLESARGAGLHTVGLTTSGPADALARAHRVVTTLEGLTLAQLRAWFD